MTATAEGAGGAAESTADGAPELLLFRHGKAKRPRGGADFERPLSTAGTP